MNVVKCDWIESARIAFDSIIFKGGGDPFEKTLCIALENNGFISGSFARSLGRTFVLPDESGKYSLRGIADNYMSYNIHKVHAGNPNSRWGLSDIDVFFKSQEDAKRAAWKLLDYGKSINVDPAWTSVSAGGFAQESILPSGLIIQLISKNCGEPEDVIDTFDIANAKVWFDNDGFHYSDVWLELEKDRILGIDRFDKTSLVFRVKKWLRKHSYQSIRKEDMPRFVDAIFDLYAKVSTPEGIQSFGTKLAPSQVSKVIWSMITGEILKDPSLILKASLLFEGYEHMHCLKAARTAIDEENSRENLNV